ncbi:MAG: hypothetical protein VYD54_00575 [Bdellovibrionota bacterium]|nr:hypothetical protein [Bdellovibrionota bacterium]
MKKFAFLLIFLTNVYSAEVDNFTGRFQSNLNDSTKVFNKKTNDYFRKGLKNANFGLLRCNEKKLYFHLQRYFNSTFFGKIVRWVNETETLDKKFISVDKSIYRDFVLSESIVLGFIAKLRSVHSPNLRMGEVYLGSDKFEHFFSSGFRYFTSMYLKRKGIKKTLMIGLKEEYGLLGRIPTGVISYADLAADFNGMRFWNHVLQKNNDILGKNFNFGPYVKCKRKKWVLVKKMDWSKYLDHSMDEAINCSQFKKLSMVKKVKNRLKGIRTFEQRVVSCPIDKNKLKKMFEKYGRFAPFFINQEGHRVVDMKDNPLIKLKDMDKF